MAAVSRLVAVSWAMPPRVAPRALQVSRLLCSLRGFGWESTVIAATPGAGMPAAARDALLAAHYRDAYTLQCIETDESVAPSGRVRRLLRRLRAPADLTEDNWERRATGAAARALRAPKADALVTFAQPWSDHRIGLRLRRRMGRGPWVAHFSDPWTDSPYYAELPGKDLARWRGEEQRVIEQADAAVFVTEETRELVMSKYPRALAARAHVLPHAFDPTLAPLVAAAASRLPPHDGRLRITHTGFLYPGMRTPHGMLAALARLRETRPDVLAALEVIFVGDAPGLAPEALRPPGLERTVSFLPRAGYIESLRASHDADVLLVIDAPSERSVFLPSKIVDYLMFRKPILGVTPLRGASAEFLRRLGDPVVEPGDAAGLAAALADLVRLHREGRLRASSEHEAIAAEYTAEHVAKRFDALLRGLVARSSVGRRGGG
jgi:glycosyltransferase involved in cell wall biosynthesis